MTRRLRRQPELEKSLPSHLILYSHSPSLLISSFVSPPPLSPPPPLLTQEVHKDLLSNPCFNVPPLLISLTCSTHCLLTEGGTRLVKPVPRGCKFGWAQMLIECWVTLSWTQAVWPIVASILRGRKTQMEFEFQCASITQKWRNFRKWTWALNTTNSCKWISVHSYSNTFV